MTTTQPPLAAAFAETAAAAPTPISATFDAANRELAVSGTAQAPDRTLTLTENHELEFPVLSDVTQATIGS